MKYGGILNSRLLGGGLLNINILTIYMARPIAYRERDDPEGGGLYCFYPFDSPLDEHCKGIFKIGLAIDFKNRTGNYHTYLPMGVYRMAILQNPDKESKYFETLKMYYLKIEKQIYDDIVADGGYPIYMAIRKQNQGRTEWIYTDQKSIHKAFTKAHNDYGGKVHLYSLRLPKKSQTPIFTGSINYYYRGQL